MQGLCTLSMSCLAGPEVPITLKDPYKASETLGMFTNSNIFRHLDKVLCKALWTKSILLSHTMIGGTVLQLNSSPLSTMIRFPWWSLLLYSRSFSWWSIIKFFAISMSIIHSGLAMAALGVPRPWFTQYGYQKLSAMLQYITPIGGPPATWTSSYNEPSNSYNLIAAWKVIPWAVAMPIFAI